MDFILNGAACGNVAATMLLNGFDVGALRPWIGQDGRAYQSLTQNGKTEAVVTNSVATLRKDEWIQLDQVITKAAKERLAAVADLRAAGLEYTIPNGLGKTVLQTESQSDITAATTSMDGLRESDADRPECELTNLPLPIIHKDFFFSARQLAASRQGGSPLDTTTAELAARRVAEAAEKMLLGTLTGMTYGGGTIYGYTNLSGRMTKSLTDPTSSGYTPADTLADVLDMRAKSQAAFHYGPWMLYCAPAWDLYLDDDFSTAKGDITLRERLAKIQGIQAVKTLDYLTDYTMVLVQMTSDVVREVVGMDTTTVQWESKGGMQINFKVMAILVPQLRKDYNGNGGIVHGSVA